MPGFDIIRKIVAESVDFIGPGCLFCDMVHASCIRIRYNKHMDKTRKIFRLFLLLVLMVSTDVSMPPVQVEVLHHTTEEVDHV
jgi:hypothetical protein